MVGVEAAACLGGDLPGRPNEDGADRVQAERGARKGGDSVRDGRPPVESSPQRLGDRPARRSPSEHPLVRESGCPA